MKYILFVLSAVSMLTYGNILSDGGFERPLEENWLLNNGGITVEFARDTAVFRSGAASARMRVAAGEKQAWPAIEKEFPDGAPAQYYKAVFYLKVDQVKGIAYAAIEYLDAQGKRISHDQAGGVSGTSDDWVRMTLSGVTPAGTVKVRFRLLLMGSGSVWFDDVTLTRKENYSATPTIAKDVVRIRNTGEVITANFGGFGAETDPWLFNSENRKKGVVDEDGDIIFGRMKDMGMSIARVFVPWSMWNPSVDAETFDWTSDGMQSLYRILDMHQKIGSRVIICTVEWGAKNPLEMPAEKHGKGVAALLDHLVNKKGYSCIAYYMVYNEPEITFKKKGFTFERYVELNRSVHEALAKAGLRKQIRMAVADESSDISWFRLTAKSLNDIADMYSTHSYKRKNDVAAFGDHIAERWDILKKLDPNWKNKEIMLTEFGVSDKSTIDTNNRFMRTYENGLLIGNVCIDTLAQGVSGLSIWTLHRVNYPGFNFMDYGLWEFKNEDWKFRPVYFSYSLFTRYCPRGAQILRTSCDEPEGLIRTVAASANGTVIVFVMNGAFNDQKVSIDPGIPAKSYRRARYDETISAESTDLAGIAEGPVNGTFTDTVPRQSITVFRFK
ncbi:MAG: hypothetical protein AABZ39_04280 [Spirochaetota bacterium]